MGNVNCEVGNVSCRMQNVSVLMLSWLSQVKEIIASPKASMGKNIKGKLKCLYQNKMK